MLSLCLNL